MFGHTENMFSNSLKQWAERSTLYYYYQVELRQAEISIMKMQQWHTRRCSFFKFAKAGEADEIYMLYIDRAGYITSPVAALICSMGT